MASDERESGRRALLNYGHTLAHALETAGDHQLRHGEAVAIGLVYAAELAHRLGRIGEAQVVEHRRVVSAYDLPSRVPADLDAAELVDADGARQEGARRRADLRARRTGRPRGRRRRRPGDGRRHALEAVR